MVLLRRVMCVGRMADMGRGMDEVRSAIIISPTLKRTEGRAPVWGSEFTSKDAALQGWSAKLLLG